MNQGKKDRLAKFRQKSETYDCRKDEGGKVFVALLDERIALDAQSRAQADHASSNPSSDPNSPSAAATNDDEDDGPNDDPSTIDATINEEPADNEDGNMKKILIPLLPQLHPRHQARLQYPQQPLFP
jgi:hypothetical protein